MRLIVHLGFHKTASTYLQHLMNRHHAMLRDRGIWYEPQPGYPAHHFAAWDVLMGDASRLTKMIEAGRAHGCSRVIFSSEDLEAIVYNASCVELIESSAAAAGIEEIEWHVTLREPGAYFASLHAQLQYHVYADAVVMFTEVLRRGNLFIADPSPGELATPYWCYCFDHHAHLREFSATTRFPIVVHDYADDQPYPGWRILARLGAMDVISTLSDDEARNRRLPADAVAEGYRQRIIDALGGVEIDEMLATQIDSAIRANLDAVPILSAAVSKKFADSHRMAVEAFGARD